MRVRNLIGILSSLVLAGCPLDGDSTQPIPEPTLSLTGDWSTLETETNIAKTRCAMQYTLELYEDSDSTVTGTLRGNASVPCQAEPRTALDSAQRIYDPGWGLTVVTIAPVNVWGTRSGQDVYLVLRSPLWELTGTMTLTGGVRVTGTARKRDHEFPPDNFYDGTFTMTKISR